MTGISALKKEALKKKKVCVREGLEKKEPSHTVGGNANQYSHHGEQCGDSFKNWKIGLPYNPAIPLLGIHTEETRIERDTCTPMFTAALFTIARTWKQPRGSKQMDKVFVVHIHSGILLSYKKEYI